MSLLIYSVSKKEKKSNAITVKQLFISSSRKIFLDLIYLILVNQSISLKSAWIYLKVKNQLYRNTTVNLACLEIVSAKKVCKKHLKFL